MKRLFFLLPCLVVILATSLPSTAQVAKGYPPQKDSIRVGAYVIKTIPVTHGFGYDIYVDNKLFIHQTSIPAVAGNNGFATKAEAENVAKKVIEKMQKGDALPTMSVTELKALGVHHD
jgi:hypothetical protein